MVCGKKIVVKFVVKLKDCQIGTKIGVVVDMDPVIMIVVTKRQKRQKLQQKNTNKKQKRQQQRDK